MKETIIDKASINYHKFIYLQIFIGGYATQISEMLYRQWYTSLASNHKQTKKKHPHTKTKNASNAYIALFSNDIVMTKS